LAIFMDILILCEDNTYLPELEKIIEFIEWLKESEIIRKEPRYRDNYWWVDIINYPERRIYYQCENLKELINFMRRYYERRGFESPMRHVVGLGELSDKFIEQLKSFEKAQSIMYASDGYLSMYLWRPPRKFYKFDVEQWECCFGFRFNLHTLVYTYQYSSLGFDVNMLQYMEDKWVELLKRFHDEIESIFGVKFKLFAEWR